MGVKDFVELLIAERKRRGFSRTKMANALGVAPGTINAIENGTQRPTLDFIRTLAKYLGKYPEELLRLAYPDDFAPSGQAAVDPSDRLILEEFNRLPKSIRDFILTAVMDYGGVGDAGKKGK